MPYIKQENRGKYKSIENLKIDDVGELNYVISLLIKNYIGDKVRYKKINDVIGVLECAKLEAYRRIAAKYENMKIYENGDVYAEYDFYEAYKSSD